MTNIFNDINKLYNKQGYYEKYGISVIITIIIIVIFVVIWSYFKIMNDIKPIKDDWVNQRCNPTVIPLAGFINKPDDMTNLEFTSKNFSSCTKSILRNVTKFSVSPINYSISLINNLMNSMLKSMQMMRILLSKFRNGSMDVTKNIMARLSNIMIPIQQVIIAIKSILGKIQGIMATGLYTTLGVYMTIKSTLGNILQGMIAALIALSVLIVSLWILPVTWPLAGAMTAIFATLAIIVGIFAIFIKNVLKMSGGGKIPNKPKRCFDGDTIIELNDGTYSKIKDINCNSILKNNNCVTSIFKFSSDSVKMYKYKNIIVTGDHLIKINNNIKSVKELNDSYEVDNYNNNYIYCLNTTNKNIIINNNEFLDYDELSNDEINELKEKSKFFNKNIYSYYSIKENNTEWISQLFEGGFSGNTILDLHNGNKKNIKEISVGDVLKNNITVLGKVTINGNKLNNLKILNINNEDIILGPNIHILNNNIISNLDSFEQKYNNKIDYLYNIITDKSIFNIGEITFLDYNSCIDLFLKEDSKIFLKNINHNS